MQNRHKAIGSLLKESRVRLGLSQAFVTHRLGYTNVQFLSNIERGLCSPPIEKLKILTEIYKLNPRTVINLIVGIKRSELEMVFLSKKR